MELLTDVMTLIHAKHRAAGLPSHAGDGLPLACLALHHHVSSAFSPWRFTAAGGAARGLLLTLDMAQCVAPDDLPIHIARLTSCSRSFPSSKPLTFADLGRLPLPLLGLDAPKERQVHAEVTNLMCAWTTLDALDDTSNAGMLRNLAYLAVYFARLLDAHRIPPQDHAVFDDLTAPHALLYPIRTRHAC